MKNQAALLVLDVFPDQMTDEVISPLKLHNIWFATVPGNITHLFQPLDLTVNGHCKVYIKISSPNGIRSKLIMQLKMIKK